KWGYRRRARLGVKFVHKKGCVVVGFRERAAPYVAQLSRCEVLTAPVGELIAPLAVMLGELTIREQLPQIEVAVADNATALVLRVLAIPSEADLARLREFAGAHRLRLYLQPGGLDSVRELEPPGEPLRYALAGAGVELEFAPTDFIQVNGAVNDALIARAGARAVLAAVAALAPRGVLYVSCQPGSLARDLSMLVHEHGFELEKAGVVDMFPHTAHVESLALLVPGGPRTAAGRPAA